MLEIKDKNNCCGCSACVSICPRQCITMQQDEEGFPYPSIDLDKCIDCHLCEKVCPELNSNSGTLPVKTLAAYNKNIQIRNISSSGGIFTLIAESILNDNGIVFGASFDREWKVRHVYIENIEDLSGLRGSKYSQSVIGDCFSKAKEFLDSGRKVLFSGTPCQIAGLKNYLKKDYENLLTMDVVCHGVPSPMVWQKYLESLEAKVTSVSFRNKEKSWKNYRVKISSAGNESNVVDEEFLQNRFMQVFLSDLSLRSSCYTCKSKSGSSGSDITLGDFWGIDKIEPKIDDDQGMNLVLINTEKGNKFLEDINCESFIEPYSEAIKYNPAIISAVNKPCYRDLFMTLCRVKGFDKAYKTIFDPGIRSKIKRRLLSIKFG